MLINIKHQFYHIVRLNSCIRLLIIIYKSFSVISEPEREPPVGCRTDGECRSKLACFNSECDDPCKIIQPCGLNAKCRVIDTLPFRTMTCACLPDFTGNAYIECIPRKACDFVFIFEKNHMKCLINLLIRITTMQLSY